MQANLISTFFMQNLWVNQITFDLDQAKFNIFFSAIINEDFGICPGFGWERERVYFQLKWTMKWWNC